jgi:hypothetical protein
MVVVLSKRRVPHRPNSPDQLQASSVHKHTQLSIVFVCNDAVADFLAFLTRLCELMALVSFGDRDGPGLRGQLGMPGLHLRSAPRALHTLATLAVTSAAEYKMHTGLPIPSTAPSFFLLIPWPTSSRG